MYKHNQIKGQRHELQMNRGFIQILLVKTINLAHNLYRIVITNYKVLTIADLCLSQFSSRL